MNFCHFVTKHFYTLYTHELGEDTTIILFTNRNDTFFYLNLTFFQTGCKNQILHFVKKTEKVSVTAELLSNCYLI